MEGLIVVIVVIALFASIALEFYFAKKTQDRYFAKLEKAITNALINGSRK